MGSVQIESAAGFVTIKAMRGILSELGKPHSRLKLWRLIRKRNIPTCRIGRVLLVSPAAVFAALGMI